MGGYAAEELWFCGSGSGFQAIVWVLLLIFFSHFCRFNFFLFLLFALCCIFIFFIFFSVPV